MTSIEIEPFDQYLTFTLDEEVYALEIAKVREVLEFTRATRVPRTPDYMRGVINLRGNVVALIDLKQRFAIGIAEETIDTCSVIVEVSIDGAEVVLGVLADSVQEVIELGSEQIEPPPQIGTRLDVRFIKGMGKRDDEFIIILDIDRVFSGEDVDMVRQSTTASQSPVEPPVGATASYDSSGTPQ